MPKKRCVPGYGCNAMLKRQIRAPEGLTRVAFFIPRSPGTGFTGTCDIIRCPFPRNVFLWMEALLLQSNSIVSNAVRCMRNCV